MMHAHTDTVCADRLEADLRKDGHRTSRSLDVKSQHQHGSYCTYCGDIFKLDEHVSEITVF